MVLPGVPFGGSGVASVLGNWVPGARPLEPFPAFNFAVEIEGIMVGGFTKVEGLAAKLETMSYREGGVNGYAHTLPVGIKQPNLVLRHGLTASSSLWNWYDNIARGVIQRRNGTIMMLDRQQIPVMWWNFRNAMPIAWTGPTLDAGSSDMAFESITLAHQGLTKPILGQALAAAQGLRGMAGA